MSISMSHSSLCLTARIILINVGGEKYSVSSWKILNRFPQTRLGKLCACSNSKERLMEICDDYLQEEKEYFFNRSPKTFPSVLNYYYTGKLHVPTEVCVVAFADDLKYWGFEELQLDICCRHQYFHLMEQVKDEIKEAEEILACTADESNIGDGFCAKFSRNIWNIFENPMSSIMAKVVAVISISFIMVSTFLLVLNTVPGFNMIECVHENITICKEELEADEGNIDILATRENWVLIENYYFGLTENICIAWFTFEYIARLSVSPRKCEFLKDMLNIFDLLAILPYFINVLIFIMYKGDTNASFHKIRRVIQICRLLKTIRVFRLARHSTGLQSLVFTLVSSYKELGILFLFIIMGVLFFSSLAYYVEMNETTFESIPAAFWWAAVTMNAVGLGDMKPVTTTGKFISFICGVCGMLFVGLPIPVIVDSFASYYKHQKRRLKIVKRYESLQYDKMIRTRDVEPLMTESDLCLLGEIASLIEESDVEFPSSLSIPCNLSRPTLNVGGVRFQITWNLLDQLPNSRLGQLRHCTDYYSLMQICDDYVADGNEYFFHRDPKSFFSILNFYYCGKLHLLENSCPVAFEDETSYWMVDVSILQSCCRQRMSKKKEEVCKEITEIENILIQIQEQDFGSGITSNLRKCIWNLLENPNSSCLAKCIALVSSFITLLSAFILTLKTMHDLSVMECENAHSHSLPAIIPSHIPCPENTSNPVRQISPLLLNIEFWCITWFGLEYIARLVVSPNKADFLRGKLNALDPIIVLSYILSSTLIENGIEPGQLLKYLCEMLRILRILKIFKLGKYSTALEALGFTLKSSFKHFGILVLFLAIGVLVFSSLIYVSEKEENPAFNSIPATFWWALPTMHTVAIGDVQTTTVLGKIVSFVCGLFGLLFLVLPIPIIASNFNEFYKKKMRRERAQRDGYSIDLLTSGEGDMMKVGS